MVLDELGGLNLPSFINPKGILPEFEDYVNSRKGRLHTGELSSIALCLQLRADIVLLDDKLARMEADRMSCHILGTIGILLKATRQGLLDTSKTAQLIEDLTYQHGMFISKKLLTQIGEELQTIR